MRRLLLAATFLPLAWSAAARADGAGSAIDELKQGYAIKQAGHCEDAVAHFKRSFELDPTPKALLNLADCEQQLGDLVGASRDAAAGRDLAQKQNSDELAAVASTQLAAIDKRLPRLTIRLARSAPPDTVVARDGTRLEPAQVGQPIPLNPGPHTVLASAKGYADRQFEVFISEGASAQIEAGPGPAAAGAAPAPPVVEPVPQAAPAPAAPPETPAQPAAQGHGQEPQRLRWPAYAAWGVGGAGLVLGVATGLAAVSKHGTLTSNCPGNVCPSTEQGDLNAFQSLRTVSTVGYVIALLGAAAGTTLWFVGPTAPADVPPAAGLWVGPGSAGLAGRF